MYCRNFSEPPKKIINTGKAEFGTFQDVSPKIDIRGMHSPYAGVPLPSILSNLRIKSRLCYVFALDKHIGISEFYDFKVFGLADIIFWNKESGKKYVYHTFMPLRRRFIPVNTNRGICASYKKSRYIKISWGRQHQHHALTFKVKGDSARPDAEGYFYSAYEDLMHSDTLCVNPSPTSYRCSATWINATSIQGHLSIKGETADDSTGLAIQSLNRTYYKLHSKIISCYGLGKIGAQNVVFHISQSNLDAADPDKYNDNILIVDGERTTLPSVVITHPFGPKKNWIIQDTESMIDLTFTPESLNNYHFNIIALRTISTKIYGTFEGILLNSKGEKIILKNFPGVINRNFLRI